MGDSNIDQHVKTALTIGGFDPSGGAGISADTFSFHALGLHGASVLTSIVPQNTSCVISISPIEVDLVELQLDAVLKDLNVVVAKTGLLATPELVTFIGVKAQEWDFPLVVDPVLGTTMGGGHSTEKLVMAFKKLMQRAYLLTPNLPEAGLLLGRLLEPNEDPKDICMELSHLGASNVLLTGGHGTGEMVLDTLWDGNGILQWNSPRIEGEHHGTGCMLSSLIAGRIGLGWKLEKSVESSLLDVAKAIQEAVSPGKGAQVVRLGEQST